MMGIIRHNKFAPSMRITDCEKKKGFYIQQDVLLMYIACRALITRLVKRKSSCCFLKSSIDRAHRNATTRRKNLEYGRFGQNHLDCILCNVMKDANTQE